MKRALALVAFLSLSAAALLAQDPVQVDARHYKVEFENADVRVLRIHYGPHEKSPMHYHPKSVATFLTDANGQFHMPDGSTVPMNAKAGSTVWEAAGKHAPENTGDQPLELILVELKHSSAAKPAAKPAD